MSVTRFVRRWIWTRNLMMAKRKKQKERPPKLSLPKVLLSKEISRDRDNPKGSPKDRGNLRGSLKDRGSLRGKDEARDGMGEETGDVEGISKEDVTAVGISPHIISRISGVRGSKRSSK